MSARSQRASESAWYQRYEAANPPVAPVMLDSPLVFPLAVPGGSGHVAVAESTFASTPTSEIARLEPPVAPPESPQQS